MRLKVEEFEELAKRKGFRSGYMLWRKIGGGRSAYALVEKGIGVAYEVMKNLYNLVGEKEMVNVVDFEEETINGFKAKYIELGDKLY